MATKALILNTKSWLKNNATPRRFSVLPLIVCYLIIFKP